MDTQQNPGSMKPTDHQIIQTLPFKDQALAEALSTQILATAAAFHAATQFETKKFWLENGALLVAEMHGVLYVHARHACVMLCWRLMRAELVIEVVGDEHHASPWQPPSPATSAQHVMIPCQTMPHWGACGCCSDKTGCKSHEECWLGLDETACLLFWD